MTLLRTPLEVSRVDRSQLIELLKPVKLVLMDVDGVLTDGRFDLLPSGVPGQLIEMKAFDSQDGLALQWLRQYDIPTGLISGRDSPATTERASSAGFRYVFQRHLDKRAILNQIADDSGVEPKAILYIGDDLTDFVIMRRVGVAVAVANARLQVKRASHFVRDAPGGAGAVREVIEPLLQAKGVWEKMLQRYDPTD